MEGIGLEQIIEMQRDLDSKIVEGKELQERNLVPETTLALIVEIGEMANEYRGFKFWSNDQNPRTKKIHSDRDGYVETNPLLEEYVDAMHFFISLAIRKGWEDHLFIAYGALEDTAEQGLDGGVVGAINESVYWLTKSYMETGKSALTDKIETNFGVSGQEFYFKNAWYCFAAVGMVGFGFKWEQIADAYMTKNAENHKRQATGY